MAVLIASISAPNVTIATLVAKAIGKRFSLKDETGTPRDGTKADLENALREVIRDWVIQYRAEEAARVAKATETPIGLT